MSIGKAILKQLRVIRRDQRLLLRNMDLINERIDRGLGMSLSGIHQGGGRWNLKDTLTNHLEGKPPIYPKN